MEYLKGVVLAKASSSAGWKEMLKLRDKARKHILWKVRDDMSINVWYDNWCPISPICDIVTTREIYEAGLNINTTMNELVNKYEGTWPEGWSNEYLILNQSDILRTHDGTRDKAIWLDMKGKENMFSVRQ
nr:hypothetical protein [Tanacetum cinerariifolium]